MKKKRRIIVLFFLLVTACALITTKRENPNCNLEFLSLNEEWMPKGWERSGLGPAFLPIQDRLGSQQAYYIFMENNDKAGRYTVRHTVYQYSNRWLATFYIRFNRELFFPSVSWDWLELEGASNWALDANQVQIRCGDSNYPDIGNRCVAVLRYGPYISDFGSSIEEGVMSIEEFKEIVLKIDEQFRSCQE